MPILLRLSHHEVSCVQQRTLEGSLIYVDL